MTTPDPQTCEVRIGSAWRGMSLADATTHHPMGVKRCPACHGRITIHRNYTAQGGFWFQHRTGHDGCPLMSNRYAGMPSPHPQALG